ncbi:hypothetical protein BX661DRAFT_64365 [Kickxella alabastrina]|uniref:uncharacterized protein n=1 Tax=Kickxella alabastrina TaxID=61397 RepID=UPI00221F9B50|nr:uncharacterized protein BX661DRAFT_64365 [Kickxella alabastrina]KAI7833716.1 hypothetical protein BX661DRAFT_64365 [Kickxella alabastrina]
MSQQAHQHDQLHTINEDEDEPYSSMEKRKWTRTSTLTMNMDKIRTRIRARLKRSMSRIKMRARTKRMTMMIPQASRQTSTLAPLLQLLLQATSRPPTAKPPTPTAPAAREVAGRRHSRCNRAIPPISASRFHKSSSPGRAPIQATHPHCFGDPPLAPADITGQLHRTPQASARECQQLTRHTRAACAGGGSRLQSTLRRGQRLSPTSPARKPQCSSSMSRAYHRRHRSSLLFTSRMKTIARWNLEQRRLSALSRLAPSSGRCRRHRVIMLPRLRAEARRLQHPTSPRRSSAMSQRIQLRRRLQNRTRPVRLISGFEHSCDSV